MDGQLHLIDRRQRHATWRLDERTRVTGQRGIVAARMALQEALRRNDPDGPAEPSDEPLTAEGHPTNGEPEAA
jgi:hypothetical protein